MIETHSKFYSFSVGVMFFLIFAFSSEVARADSFFDTGKVYTIFGFSFCFPACPYESAAVPYTKYALVDKPLPR